MVYPKDKLKQYILDYLEQNRVMTLATCMDDIPWAASVMYAYDDDLNLYFISKPETRKTQNLLSNPKVSATINQFQKTPGKILGIQLEGTARKLDKTKNVQELELFKKRFDWAKDFLDDHELFQIAPKKIYYLDDEKFGPQGREELIL
jgi:uncharacterized protein YhbP (UPF0306 family)